MALAKTVGLGKSLLKLPRRDKRDLGITLPLGVPYQIGRVAPILTSLGNAFDIIYLWISSILKTIFRSISRPLDCICTNTQRSLDGKCQGIMYK